MTSISFSSCLEIVEEIDLDDDGSGKAMYTINLSQSKIKLAAALKLDSINGKKTPSIDEINNIIISTANSIQSQEGIKSCDYRNNFDDFIFELNISFENINSLNYALKNVPYWDKSDWKPTKEFYQHSKNSFSKNSEEYDLNGASNKISEYKTELEQGFHTFILRGNRNIISKEGANARISGNKTAVMQRTNLFELLSNPQNLSLNINF